MNLSILIIISLYHLIPVVYIQHFRTSQQIFYTNRSPDEHLKNTHLDFMSFKILLIYDSYSFPLHALFVEKIRSLSQRIFEILNLAICFPVVLLSLFPHHPIFCRLEIKTKIEFDFNATTYYLVRIFPNWCCVLAVASHQEGISSFLSTFNDVEIYQ